MGQSRNNIAKNSLLIAVLVCAGKVLGFIKQSVIAWGYGANTATDLFFAADGFTSTIANVLSMSIAPAVLTAYLLIRNERGDKDADSLIGRSLLFFSAIGIILIVINSVFSAGIADVIGISYAPDQKKTLGIYVIILSASILFASMAGVLQGYLNANSNYAPGRLAGLFYSVFMILGVFLFRNTLGVGALILGFLTGYALHTVFLMVYARKVVRFPSGNMFSDSDFRHMLRNFVPLLISLSIVDFGHLIDKIIASSLEEGSVSILNYGQVISSDLVNAVVITTVGTVLLTSFTDSVSKGEKQEVISSSIQNVITTLCFLVLLLTSLYYVEGNDLIEVILQRGNFNASGTSRVYSVAFFYALGFIFMAIREILVKAHYAYQDMKAPVLNSAVGVVTNLVLSIVLSRTLGVSGIALATSISLLVVSVLSALTLKKHIGELIINGPICLDFLKMAVCCAAAVAAGLLLRNRIESMAHVIRMILVGSVMCAVYFLIALIIRERVVVGTTEKVISRLRKKQ